ncbi:MAG: bifunctional phosphoribosylaminoimidazolecarboxamide formyltransferase/IMP cyclohydrolase [Dehalococcoidia bacterium]|nr:bifunctional phosphoribosylaminoimidazolecarboxamide formyltransferase/IMP cyclohydrolase [Dehalococcoidia bacterium]
MRAILAPYDKAGLVEFARGLRELGWELLATGGTERALREAGLEVTAVADFTGSPEMLEGRVKTLHPRIHGGLLYRRGHAGDEAEVAAHGLDAIDLFAGNLYPFVETVTRDGATFAEALENIDIGGPAMIRSAAKNHPSVIPLVDPSDYPVVLEALRGGGLDAGARRALAARAFQHVARYDTLVAEYLRGEDAPLPPELTLAMTRREELRYGENPHQRGAFYRLDSVTTLAEGIGGAVQHHGKALSFVNILDADAAFNLVADFAEPTVAIIKHTNPCCFATGAAGGSGGLAKLFERALVEGDSVSAYGGIVAVNRPLDMGLAAALRDVLSPVNGVRMFYEIVIVPDADPEALEHLKKKSRDLRILTAPLGDPHRARLDFRAVRGGVVVQGADVSEETAFEVVSKRQPSAMELADLRTAWVVCKHVKSNGVVYVKDGLLIGMGAGQPNRVQSARIGAEQAGERARGAVCASDALIPFPDTIEVSAAAGVTAVVHTGGSIRDDESVATADRLGVSLLTTGARHFRH